jgi:Uncharacterised protein family (UPF0236)
MSYERQYYYDKEDRRGYHPLDGQLKVDQDISHGLARLLVKLSADHTYQSSADTLSELMRVSVSDSSAWREMQKAGERLQAMEQGYDRTQTESEGAATNKVMGATVDGFMVNIRGEKEGWREVKVGCLFEICPEDTTEMNRVGEEIPVIKSRNQTYATHLGEPAGFVNTFLPLTETKHWKQASETAYLGDGAVWIWNIAQAHFSDSAHGVDWYHAKQHLWNAAHSMYPDDQSAAQNWVKHQSDLLYAGEAKTIANCITNSATTLSPKAQKDLNAEAGYFERNHERMQYRDLQLGGIPIGSGTVEAGAKQFKHRFTGTGMRWSRKGIANALPFRDALLSHQFDVCWHAVCPF